MEYILLRNVSIKEIFRYAKPSQAEMQTTIEELNSKGM